MAASSLTLALATAVSSCSCPEPEVELSVVIDEPIAGANVSGDGELVSIVGRATSNEAITSVVVNGIRARYRSILPEGGFQFTAFVPVYEAGRFTATAVATTESTATASTSVTFDVTFTGDRDPPVVTIVGPEDRAIVQTASVEISGTVSEVSEISIAGRRLPTRGTNFSSTVSLNEGTNVILVSAVDEAGNVGSAEVAVVRDETPPSVSVTAPLRGALVGEAVDVIGAVFDRQAGDTDVSDCQVFVNGVEAEIDRNSFIVPRVPVPLGQSHLTVVAEDIAGNRSSVVVPIRRTANSSGLTIVSGNGQSARVMTALADPLVVRLTTAAGEPQSGQQIAFSVARGSGTFNGTDRRVAVTTDGMGQASVRFTLGGTAGAANNVIRAETQDGRSVTFTAAGQIDPSSPSRVIAVSGGNTNAIAGAILETPLVALVMDPQGNPRVNAEVTFEAVRGGVWINGARSTSVRTNTDGRALAVAEIRRGSRPGSALVKAFAAGESDEAFFPLTILPPTMNGGETRVSGVVLSNEREPVVGATISVRGARGSVTTDQAGRFSLSTGGQVGRIFVNVDASTVTSETKYADLAVEPIIIEGIDNALNRPILVPELDDMGLVITSTLVAVEITRPDIPGFYLRIPPGSVTFADGSKIGELRVVSVNQDAVPMVPPNGSNPQSVIAIKPASVTFDPPAEFRMPNANCQPAGAVSPIYSYDHEISDWVAVGLGGVSDDRRSIVSEPGLGLVRGGWHVQPPVPAAAASCIGPAGMGTCYRLTCDYTTCSAGAYPSCYFENPSSPEPGGVGAGGELLPMPSPDDDCYLMVPVGVCGSDSDCTITANLSEPTCIRRVEPVNFGTPTETRACTGSATEGMCVVTLTPGDDPDTTDNVAGEAVCCVAPNQICRGTGCSYGDNPVCCTGTCDGSDCCVP